MFWMSRWAIAICSVNKSSTLAINKGKRNCAFLICVESIHQTSDSWGSSFRFVGDPREITEDSREKFCVF
ncbi:CLUMA_CG016911, isoform A [Clunio marinus]|uniref:CLUMA_CG016911, isoform A n=1 Tax=Clunio marinus TaxID=568069 RepID=A0A1J1IVD0_9DIPT|nr:CLUMA_CG016911, isoform A [Clunio marinus]